MANNFKFGDDFDLAVAGVDICADSTNINMSRTVQNVRTNCGNSQVPGANETTYDASGPLGYGSGSTEATLFTSMTATTAEAYEFDPDGSGTASATNPIYTDTIFGESFGISASVGGPITYSYNARGVSATGMPTATRA